MAAPRSLSLAAYRALTRRGTPAPVPHRPARPDGELAWIHLGTVDDMAAVYDLADRLVQMRDGLTVMLSYSAEDMTPKWPAGSRSAPMVITTAPDEHPDAVAAFLDHWRPDVALWIWGGLRPNLVDLSAKRGIPLHLVSADKAGFDAPRDRWLPELSRHLTGCFTSASARSASSAQRLARLGMPPDRITVLPPLQPSGQVLPCAQSDLDEMSAQLKGRAVWCAANTLPQEAEAVIEAHQIAVRSAHRLLLVLNPTRYDDPGPLTHALDRTGLSYAIWSEGAFPEETTQVLIADLPDELGLWYRVASVSFLGGSLVAGHRSCDPMAAACLGTAILYGPYVGAHLASYSRLAQAGAARMVKDADTLGTAVARIIAPDQAAAMAHAGWDVATQGAEVMDGVIDLVQESLDARQASATKAHA